MTAESWIEAPAFIESSWAAGWSTGASSQFKSSVASKEHADAVSALVQDVGLSGAAWAEQVHGAEVLRVDGPGPAGQADALWSDMPGLAVVGRSADCPLILVGGQRGDRSLLWGFAHASWRSTVRGITMNLIGSMQDAGAETATLRAQLCPSAGPCCYEVGPEVRQEAMDRLGPGARPFFSQAEEKGPDRWILDLWSANLTQLLNAGVPHGGIRTAGICTICSEDRYPSYRRDGEQAGRFAAIIGGRLVE